MGRAKEIELKVIPANIANDFIRISRIDELGAGMYKFEKITQAERHAIKTIKLEGKK